MSVTILDGPLGTELNARGIPTELPLWSAAALEVAPQVVRSIHADYVAAGASVHTTNTFRTRRRNAGDRWEPWTRAAVRLAREAAPDGRVAGSIAPLEDCYRPDLSPPNARLEHREFAALLADAGCDLLLCETFPHAGEALMAVEEAVRTGLETWVSLTAGPSADLLSPSAAATIARRAEQAGASAVLINCVPARDTLPFVERLVEAKLSIPTGAYANAGSSDDQIGWDAAVEPGAAAYLEYAKRWVAAGATIIGSCCGTGPEHIRALAHEFS